jgi:hypothetical protein
LTKLSGQHKQLVPRAKSALGVASGPASIPAVRLFRARFARGKREILLLKTIKSATLAQQRLFQRYRCLSDGQDGLAIREMLAERRLDVRRGVWSFSLIQILLLAVVPPGALAGPFTFSPIDVPFAGTVETHASGINAGGQIVGEFFQAGTGTHGFLDNGGSFSAIDVPFADVTSAAGINAGGQIVGFYQDGTGTHGFLDNGGSFSAIDVPFAGVTLTQPSGINDAGQIVGVYFDATGDHGFLDNGGIFSTIDVPSAGAFRSRASGINDTGQIVGVYNDATGQHGFLDSAGVFSAIDVPFAGVTTTLAAGINDTGEIVGSYNDATGTHGFLDSAGVFTVIDVPFPGAHDSEPTGINDTDQIVGTYLKSGFHGFLATPASVPEPSSIFILGSTLIVLTVCAYGKSRFRSTLQRRLNATRPWYTVD